MISKTGWRACKFINLSTHECLIKEGNCRISSIEPFRGVKDLKLCFSYEPYDETKGVTTKKENEDR